jgi:hypothetical protein
VGIKPMSELKRKQNLKDKLPSKRTIAKIQREAIAHYERMIAWAKTQIGSDISSRVKMGEELNEVWNSEDCPYCKTFAFLRIKGKKDSHACGWCPLYTCCETEWQMLIQTKTWKEWIEQAEKVLEYIKENGLECHTP